MAKKRRMNVYEPVDYSKRNKDRRKMSKYLKAGSLKKIAGSPIFNRTIRKRRIFMLIAGIAIFLIGSYFVIF